MTRKVLILRKRRTTRQHVRDTFGRLLLLLLLLLSLLLLLLLLLLEMVFTRAAPAFDNLFMGCVLSTYTVHNTVEN